MVQPSHAQMRRAYGAWVLVCIFWSTTYLAIRIAVRTLPPIMVVSGARYMAAGLILALILLVRRVPFPSRESWPGHLLLGLLMVGFGNGFLVFAEQWVPSGLAAVMQATTPFWMVGVEALLPSGERIKRSQVIGLLLGFIGILLLGTSSLDIAGGRSEMTHKFIAGLIGLQLGCAGWALGSAYSKRHARHENVLAAVALQMVFGGAILIPAGMLFDDVHAIHFTAVAFGAWVYLIVFGALVGYASYTYALKYLPVSTVSLYSFITPVLAVVLGAVILKEPFTLRMGIAAALIFAGMMVVRKTADTSSSS